MSVADTKHWVVGLTGGIGSGKTCVSDRLGELGATVIDTDIIAHQLTAAGGEGMATIRAEFGPASISPDGSLNRDYMRQAIVQDATARARLEGILHPLIRKKVREKIEKADGAYVVVVVPLLVEKGGWHDWMDDVVVVDCPREQQIRRVQTRNGWPLSQIERIIEIQATPEQRLAVATEILSNDSSLEDLLSKTDSLHTKLLEKASKSP